MSKATFTPEASCIGKWAFESAALAHQTAKRRAKRTGRGLKSEVYRCEHCSAWHLADVARSRGRSDRLARMRSENRMAEG